MLVNTYKLKITFSSVAIFLVSMATAQVMTLQQCIDTALVYNKTLQIQRNHVEMSNQKRDELKGNLLPKISANADYKYFTNLPYQYMPMSVFGGTAGQFKEAQFGVPHNINGSLQFSLPLANPQIKGGIQSAETGIELSNLQLKKKEEDVIFDITNLYYNAQILQHQIRFLDSNLANMQRLLRNMELLKEQLMATGTDVNKVKLQADQLALQKETIQSKEEQVMRALKFMMGIQVDKQIAIVSEIKYGPVSHYPPSPTIDMEITATQNTLLRNELTTMRKSAMPAVALIGSYGVNGFGYDKTPGSFLKFHPVGFAGIQLSYSLFDGGILRNKKKQKQTEIKNNELQQTLVAEQNRVEILNAENRQRVATMAITSTLNQIRQAQTIYDQTLLQQKEGLVKLNDVLLADNELREVQQNYLSAIIDYLKADLELKKFTGNISIKN